MRTLLSFSTIILLFFTKTILAQDCASLMPHRVGAEWEITNFNKKGLPESSISARLVELTAKTGGFDATVDQVITDKKERETGAFSYKFSCFFGTTSIDLSSMLSPEAFGAYQNMDLQINGIPADFPQKLEVGDALKEANIEIKVRSGSMTLMTMEFVISDRKVLAKEAVTTAAGTFDCIKISYQMDSKIGPLKMKRNTTQWISEGVGVVKSETFKGEKLESSQELTKFKQ
jgi:hypothetical protein